MGARVRRGALAITDLRKRNRAALVTERGIQEVGIPEEDNMEISSLIPQQSPASLV